ncbi:uncharacterized protein METZ01_LOCUS390533, partial [marine metagenome]
MGRNLIRVSAVMAVAALVVLGLPGVASAAIPTVPAGLTAVAGESESVILSWTASSNTPTNYDVEYSPDGFVFTST